MTSLPETASFKEFAAIAKFRASYVTQLKNENRLVLTDDGKAVRVAESLQRIEDTKDPSKIAVARRHAAARDAAAEVPVEAAAGDDVDPDAGDEATKADSGYQHWRERRERASALQAERENDKADGKLLDADDVAHAIRSGIVTLRTRLEALPDTLAPALVVVNDENRARAIIAAEIEQALDELARRFGGIAREAA